MTMDNRSSLLGFYSSIHGGNDPSSVNLPLNPGISSHQLSPYLNVNPSYLQTQPEFLTLEGASQKRGRFELAFSQIGGMTMTGGLIGGARGFYHGHLETAAAGHIGKIRRTMLINYVIKQGTSTAHTLGTIAVLYSGIGCLIWYLRDKQEDHKNTIFSAVATGLMYKSTSGLKRCLAGGLVGLALSSVYIAFNSKDKIREQLQAYN